MVAHQKCFPPKEGGDVAKRVITVYLSDECLKPDPETKNGCKKLVLPQLEAEYKRALAAINELGVKYEITGFDIKLCWLDAPSLKDIEDRIVNHIDLGFPQPREEGP